jgi:hypothetical protein
MCKCGIFKRANTLGNMKAVELKGCNCSRKIITAELLLLLLIIVILIVIPLIIIYSNICKLFLIARALFVYGRGVRNFTGG